MAVFEIVSPNELIGMSFTGEAGIDGGVGVSGKPGSPAIGTTQAPAFGVNNIIASNQEVQVAAIDGGEPTARAIAAEEPGMLILALPSGQKMAGLPTTAAIGSSQPAADAHWAEVLPAYLDAHLKNLPDAFPEGIQAETWLIFIHMHDTAPCLRLWDSPFG